MSSHPTDLLLKEGKAAFNHLGSADVLAVTVGLPVQCASELLERFGDLAELARSSVEEIMRLEIKGLGRAKAVAIVACFELGRRRQAHRLTNERITSSKDIYERIWPKLADKPHEEFHAIFINRSNYVIREECMSIGGLSGTVADQRLIFKRAIEHRASYLAVAHNHPSGSLKPSQADVRLTRSIVDGGKLLDIILLDHLIITDSSYYSFADDGRL